MANRKLPFWYCMESGQICVVDDEAEIIRMIFTSYAEGNLGQVVAYGYKNIRIYVAASVHVSQHSILIVDIRYSLVQFNNFQTPEHPPFTDCLEVVEHLLEDLRRLPIRPSSKKKSSLRLRN